ncbi:hypothetical protein BFAG_01004 [Bacteroides fragilis 3_1_12]|uniref:Uncharacterized protein n=1 Tax=Bacteroides fragilis 3_1_12 TaxID=457424 RepID=A0ABN0BHA9_BACFG|nr:hypothetical protein BFAG_01004 [Bacteroides fragilis 3_1_12]
MTQTVLKRSFKDKTYAPNNFSDGAYKLTLLIPLLYHLLSIHKHQTFCIKKT